MSFSAVSNIEVIVETAYQGLKLDAGNSTEHFFSYRITIENNGLLDVQLLSRYWKITDAFGHFHEVRGEGVVGETPVIRAGESYQYVSGTSFPTKVGKMEGRYHMIRLSDDLEFEVPIKTFHMTAEDLLN